MPQVQILARQEDPTAKLLSQAGNDIAGTLQKKRELQQQAESIKIQAQHEKTAAAQLGDDHKKTVIDISTKLAQQVADLKSSGASDEVVNTFIQTAYPTYGHEIVHNMMLTVGKGISALDKVKRDKEVAETEKFKSEADLNNADPFVQQMKQRQQAMQTQQPQRQPQVLQPTPEQQMRSVMLQGNTPQQAQAMPAQADPVQARMQTAPSADTSSLPGGGLMTQYRSKTGANIEFPDAQRQMTMMQETAKQDAELQKNQPNYINFKDQYNRATQEMGGLAKTGLGGKIKGGLAGLGGEFGDLGEVKAFENARESMAIQAAVQGQGSRPSDKDTQAYMKTMPSMKYIPSTNAASFRLLDRLFRMPAASLSEKQLRNTFDDFQKNVIDADQAFVKRVKKEHPEVTDDEINAALERNHKKRGY